MNVLIKKPRRSELGRLYFSFRADDGFDEDTTRSFAAALHRRAV